LDIYIYIFAGVFSFAKHLPRALELTVPELRDS